jgi:hypothetical protein
MRRKLSWVTLVLLLSAGAVHCESRVCTSEARAGLSVTLREAWGALVCDATVTAHDGDYSEVLRLWGCTYGGAVERPGNYTLNVVAGSRSKTVSGVVVTSGDCHVNTRTVSVTLDEPNDGGEPGPDAE